jgi:hypothetical protein
MNSQWPASMFAEMPNLMQEGLGGCYAKCFCGVPPTPHLGQERMCTRLPRHGEQTQQCGEPVSCHSIICAPQARTGTCLRFLGLL